MGQEAERGAAHRAGSGKSSRLVEVLDPRAPLAASRRLLPSLRWGELAEVAASPAVNPVLRRGAETILASRLDELTEGERVALARRAGRGLIGALAEATEARVLNALLSNPRLVEADALRVASGSEVPAETLTYLVAESRWGRRRALRLAVLRNRRTPIPVALGLLPDMLTRDLQRLIADTEVPTIVRVGAERRLRKPAPGDSPAAACGSCLSRSSYSAKNRSGQE